MSGLETLPPDQRAVLQLILVQGRGYDDLAALLRLDAEAVRSRAHAAVDGLGLPGGDAVGAAQRTRIADYLLGQQDDGERIVTFAELGESAAACRWAQALRERLAGVATDELPQVPASASANGAAPAKTPALAAAPTAVAGATTVASPPSAQASRPAATAVADAPAPKPTPPASGRDAGTPGGPRPSRLGGAVLLAGIAVLAIVLAIVLIGGGDDGGSPAATTPQQSAATQPSTTPAAEPEIVGQVNLTATPAGGQALGVGLVQRAGRAQALAIEAQRLPANGAQDFYAVWLQGGPGTTFLGFVPRQVRADGSFTVSAGLPANARRYSTVLVTREDGAARAAPTSPGEAVLSGALRFAR